MRISDWSSDVCSSDLEALDWDDMPQGEADLILSNPPYIPEADIDGLEPEVALHDPRGALAAGQDGLDAYRSLVRLLRLLLDPDGAAVLEIGIGQSTARSDGGRVGKVWVSTVRSRCLRDTLKKKTK